MAEFLRRHFAIPTYFKLTVVDTIEGTDTQIVFEPVESSTEDGVRTALADRLSELTMEQGMKISGRAKVYIESGRKIGPFYIDVVDHGSHPLSGMPPRR